MVSNDVGSTASHRILNISFTSAPMSNELRFYEAKVFKYNQSPVRNIGPVGGDDVTILNPLVAVFNSAASNTNLPLNQNDFRIINVYQGYSYFLRLRTILHDGRYREDWVGPIEGPGGGNLPYGLLIPSMSNLVLSSVLAEGSLNSIKLQWLYPSQRIIIRENNSDGNIVKTVINDLLNPNITEYPLETTISNLTDGEYIYFVDAFRNFNDGSVITFTINTGGGGGGGGGGDLTTVFNSTSLLATDFTNATSSLEGLLDLITDTANSLTARTLMREKMSAVGIGSYKIVRNGSVYENVLTSKLTGNNIENFTNVLHIGVLSGETVTLDVADVVTDRPIYFDANIGDNFTIVYGGVSYVCNLNSSGTIIINDVSKALGDNITLGDKQLQVIGFGSTAFNPLGGGDGGDGGDGGGDPIPCFLKGTRVLTPKGYKAIENFKEGDLIVTSDDRVVSVTPSVRKVKKTTKDTAPYRIPRNLLGKGIPSADIEISPTHALMIRQDVWVVPKLMAMATSKVKQIKVGESVDYYHLEAPDYLTDNMIVEGMIAETYGGKYKGKVAYYLSDKVGGLIRIPLESISNPRRLN